MNEIIIGLVSPIGTEKDVVVKTLQENIEAYDPACKVTKISLFGDIIEVQERAPSSQIPKLFMYYLKMEFCNLIRSKLGNEFLAKLIIKYISDNRSAYSVDTYNRRIYLIDQLKHTEEINLLNAVYDSNYIQISCYAKQLHREQFLRGKARNDNHYYGFFDTLSNVNLTFGDIFKLKNTNIGNEDYITALKEIYDRQLIDLRDKYVKSIESDNINLLINKDMNENSINVDSGQEIYKIYHESHYFINTDSSKAFIKNSVLKFIKLLYGHYDEYPDTDEFGMAIAYASAMRSNYPTNRQVGASILTQSGETLALGSIRVPNQDATTSKMEAEKVRYKFEETKEKLGKYKEYIEKSNIEDSSKKEISDFLMDSLDYHPCTHAEISAIADAAKLGIAIKGATLYTTTYPCHLCLRDIITSRIKRIVYLEHYPKSKVEYIFEDLLDHHKWEIEAFEGVGPKRFAYVYNSRFLKSDSDKKFIISQRTFDYYKSAEEKELKFL